MSVSFPPPAGSVNIPRVLDHRRFADRQMVFQPNELAHICQDQVLSFSTRGRPFSSRRVNPGADRHAAYVRSGTRTLAWIRSETQLVSFAEGKSALGLFRVGPRNRLIGNALRDSPAPPRGEVGQVAWTALGHRRGGPGGRGMSRCGKAGCPAAPGSFTAGSQVAPSGAGCARYGPARAREPGGRLCGPTKTPRAPRSPSHHWRSGEGA